MDRVTSVTRCNLIGKQSSLFPTQHRILTGQLTIHHGIDKATNKALNNPSLKVYPSSGLPAILAAPPSPLHHFLAALGHRSQ